MIIQMDKRYADVVMKVSPMKPEIPYLTQDLNF